MCRVKQIYKPEVNYERTEGSEKSERFEKHERSERLERLERSEIRYYRDHMACILYI